MNAQDSFGQSYISRRNKETLSLLAVRFLRACDVFNGIYRDFLNRGCDATRTNALDDDTFFKRVKNLEESLFFDIERKSRFLFQRLADANSKSARIQSEYKDLIARLGSEGGSVDEDEVKSSFHQLRTSLLAKSIDSNIRRILHILMVLKVNFHDLEYYDVEYAQEHKYVFQIEFIFGKLGRELTEIERHELNHIKEIDKIGRKIISDTKNHIKIAMERCKALFHETSEILLHVIHESRKNELLVLNLLRERDLVDRIYGSDAHERIFAKMYMSMPHLGHTGLERALNYCRHNCNNITGLPDATADSSEGAKGF